MFGYSSECWYICTVKIEISSGIMVGLLEISVAFHTYPLFLPFRGERGRGRIILKRQLVLSRLFFEFLPLFKTIKKTVIPLDGREIGKVFSRQHLILI